MRPFCICSLSHAVRCLATAEGIPYASFLHQLSLACCPMSCDTRRLTLCVCSLTHAFRCACDRQRHTLRAHQAPVGPLNRFCKRCTSSSASRSCRIPARQCALQVSALEKWKRKLIKDNSATQYQLNLAATNISQQKNTSASAIFLACHPVSRVKRKHTLCIHSESALSQMPSIVSPQSTTYSLQPCMQSGVSRQLKAYPGRQRCILSLSHAVRCLATVEDKLSASLGMYVLKRKMQWLRDKIALDAGTLPLNLQ
jgi:hypothetical protein